MKPKPETKLKTNIKNIKVTHANTGTKCKLLTESWSQTPLSQRCSPIIKTMFNNKVNR